MLYRSERWNQEHQSLNICLLEALSGKGTTIKGRPIFAGYE